jgi:hypothetical protein
MKASSIITFILLGCITATPVFAKHEKHKGKHLPPGLQKKAMRGEPLPPGWQKKLARGEIMEKRVFQQSQIVVPIDKKGLITVRIEGKLVRLYQATREIVEVLK